MPLQLCGDQVTYLEVFHEDGYDHVDKDELSHEDKDDKEDGRNDRAHAAVGRAVVGIVTAFSQRILRMERCNRNGFWA